MRRKLLVSLLALGSLYALTGMPAFGMVTSTVRVNVPFSFIVQKTVLPAGRYVITPLDSNDPNILVIRGEDGRRSAIVVTDPVVPTANTPQGAELVFERVGNREYLTQIWESGVDDGNEIPEKETQHTGSQAAQLQTIPAHKG